MTTDTIKIKILGSLLLFASHSPPPFIMIMNVLCSTVFENIASSSQCLCAS